MSDLLLKRRQMAEAGIECTPDEVAQLLEIAELLDDLSKMSMRELATVLDQTDHRNRLIVDYIVAEFRR